MAGLLEQILARSLQAGPPGFMLPSNDETVTDYASGFPIEMPKRKASPFPDVTTPQGTNTAPPPALPWGPFAGMLEPGAGQLGRAAMPGGYVADPTMPGTDPAAFNTGTARQMQAMVGDPGPQVPMPVPRPAAAGMANPPTDVGAARRPAPGAPLDILPQAAAAAPAAMASAAAQPAAADGGGMFDSAMPFLNRVSNFLGDRSSTLLALGAGFAGAPTIGQGISRAAAAAIPAKAADEKRVLQRQQQGLSFQAMRGAGVPANMALAAQTDPEIRKAVIARYFETKNPMVVNGHVVREQADGTIKEIGNFPDVNKDVPSGFQRDTNGTLKYVPGGPADPKYKREAGERNAAPSGYRWADPENPDKGLIAIPGGPGEKVDAEVAARLGLAKSFLGQLPDIRKRVQSGELTGAWDAGMAKMGMGGPGEIRRQVDSGAEALLRMLTGAGMNATEAADYTRRYKFDYTDSVETVMSKLAQLERELNTVGETVGKGRGGWVPPSAAGGAPAAAAAAPAASVAPAAPRLEPGKSTVVNGVTIKRIE